MSFSPMLDLWMDLAMGLEEVRPVSLLFFPLSCCHQLSIFFCYGSIWDFHDAFGDIVDVSAFLTFLFFPILGECCIFCVGIVWLYVRKESQSGFDGLSSGLSGTFRFRPFPGVDLSLADILQANIPVLLRFECSLTVRKEMISIIVHIWLKENRNQDPSRACFFSAFSSWSSLFFCFDVVRYAASSFFNRIVLGYTFIFCVHYRFSYLQNSSDSSSYADALSTLYSVASSDDHSHSAEVTCQIHPVGTLPLPVPMQFVSDLDSSRPDYPKFGFQNVATNIAKVSSPSHYVEEDGDMEEEEPNHEPSSPLAISTTRRHSRNFSRDARSMKSVEGSPSVYLRLILLTLEPIKLVLLHSSQVSTF